MKPNSAKKIDTNSYQYSLQKSTENSKSKQQQLPGIFLYPSRLVTRCALSILLLPWLMALNQCFKAPGEQKPTAPPYPKKDLLSQSDPPPAYKESNQCYEDDDLNTEIKLETVSKKKPKTKQDAKKYAKDALSIAEKEIENCRIYIDYFLPKLEYKHLHLQEGLASLQKFRNAITGSLTRWWRGRDIETLKKQSNRYNAKIPNEKENLKLHLQSVKDHLCYAEFCIEEAQRLGSQKEHYELDIKKKQLQNQLDQANKDSQERVKNQTIKEQRKAQLLKDFKNYLDHIGWESEPELNNRHANQVIIQQNKQD
ncbi:MULTISPECIES: hypothetical protein [unclassified Candidatus Cardinium]|uniref:hypothetical protein n=1 Tax=unclassified Candidatus Cardinium TaxID=2641185 RepID=UPI001FB56C75|nr:MULTISPECIES: hypothetical protein [unclassified Candidatus Cardinium]